MLQLCELYAEQFASSQSTSSIDAQKSQKEKQQQDSQQHKRRKLHHSPSAKCKTQKQSQTVSQREMTQEAFAVEEFVSIRINNQGLKQVLIKWQGYRRRTWEPYAEMQTQLPEMIAALEKKIPQQAKEPQSSRKHAEERALLPETDDIIISAFLDRKSVV